MEHRTELEHLLLNALPEQECYHVAKVMNHVTAEKLRRKRADGVRDNSVIDLDDAEHGRFRDRLRHGGPDIRLGVAFRLMVALG